MKQEEFLRKVKNVTNEQEAEDVIFHVYPYGNSSSENFFHTSGISDLDWDTFYAVREMEEKFGLCCYASSYLATTLAYPKISSFYSNIASKCQQEKSDFCSRVFEMTMCKLIPEWDKTVNDNFWAYMQPNLLTVRNAILEEDGGPSKYMKEKRGMSTVSMDALKEKSEAGWDTPDNDKNTEDAALEHIERDKKALLKRIVCLGDNLMATEDNIWNSIICQKLFHSQNEDELEVLNDKRITSVLNLYFNAVDNGIVDSPKYVLKKAKAGSKAESADVDAENIAEEVGEVAFA